MACMSDVNGATGGNGSVSAEQGSTTSGGWAGSGGSGGPPGGKRLERKLAGRWVAGVCAGLASYTGVDATLIRLAFALLTFVGGIGPVAYLIGWALIPEEGESVSIAERFINKTGTGGQA